MCAEKIDGNTHRIQTWYNEKHSWSHCSIALDTSQAEKYRSFVFLDDPNTEDERDRKSDDDEEDGNEPSQSTDTGGGAASIIGIFWRKRPN